MPIIVNSSYKAPLFMRNNHMQTILRALTRKVEGVEYKRERLELSDGDFLDLDWQQNANRKLIVVLHGLESSSGTSYVKGMVKAFGSRGRDAVAMNFRGCSGEPNRLACAYHSGASHDLEEVVEHIISKDMYPEIVLCGFSLGGNLLLKYLGEQGKGIPEEIKAATAVSVPCHLATGSEKMSGFMNKMYLDRFLMSLKEKVGQKLELLPPGYLPFHPEKIKTFVDFDEYFTAPVHGFSSAQDYYEKCSSKYFIKNIAIPTLLINAQDDPFLSEACFPVDEALAHETFFLEMPKYGGHVGFMGATRSGEYWHEKRIVEFTGEFVK